MMVYCSSCGRQNEDAAAYCSQCGRSIGSKGARPGSLEDNLGNFGREMGEIGKKIGQGFENTNPSGGGMEQAFGPLAPFILSIIGILIIVIGIGAFSVLASGTRALAPLVDLLWSSTALFFALLLFFSYCGYIIRRGGQSYAWLKSIMAAVAVGAAIWFAFRILAALDLGLGWNLPAWLDWLGYVIAGLVFLCLIMVALLAAMAAAQTQQPNGQVPPNYGPQPNGAQPNGGPAPDTVKRLYRSGSNKWLAGVCGGLGEYFGIDPVIVRVLWIILTLASLGIGVIAYLLLWIIVPRDPRHNWPV